MNWINTKASCISYLLADNGTNLTKNDERQPPYLLICLRILLFYKYPSSN